MLEIVRECASVNSIVSSMVHRENETLLDLIELQIGITEFNSKIHSERPYTEIIKSAEKSMSYFRLIDEQIIRTSLDLLESRVVNTANHLGGICSPQSFQGDILYCKMLERMGLNLGIVPVPATAGIPMCNCTNPRGAVLYSLSDSPYCLFFVPNREKNSIVKLTEPMRLESVISKINEFEKIRDDGAFHRKTAEELRRVYCEPSVFTFGSFGEQAGVLQYRVSQRVFQEKGPKLAYFALEELALPLIFKDIKDKNSILYYVLYDSGVRTAICRKDSKSGTSFSRLLFKGIDDRKRVFSIDFTEDGKLTGVSRKNEEISYSSDANTLISMFENNSISPGIGMILIVLFFERGLTWLGGVFQAEYLPEMQRMLSAAFNEAGYYDLERYIMSWRCDGYISGPIFMLSETKNNLLVNAGPFECIINGITWDRIQELLSTKIKDAHYMGMFEFYHDLVLSENRIEGWYGKIADYCKENYQKNRI